MTHWKLILAYDGTPFHGWQVQPGLSTIQGMLADAIHRTVGERVLPQGSGRTDAGVHALGQVASFSLAAAIPADNLLRALNRCLPPSIRILSAENVAPDFHARHSALRKTYEYRIFSLRAEAILDAGGPHPFRSDRDGWDVNPPTASDRICPPTLAPFVWPCPWPLDLAALNQAARHVLGAHDFTSFAATDPDLTTRAAQAGLLDEPTKLTPIRTISCSCWHAQDDLFIYRVTANGFLHHMVRNLVGTFVQAGAHRLDPDSIPGLLAARNRSATGPTAPPTGLFLVNVEYPPLSDDPTISTAAEPLTTEN
jgi:tRNA pseudouridine38-40 synthase